MDIPDLAPASASASAPGAAITTAAQEGDTEPTATAADQATASLDTSRYGEDATEGAAGGQSEGAGDSASPTTTTAATGF